MHGNGQFPFGIDSFQRNNFIGLTVNHDHAYVCRIHPIPPCGHAKKAKNLDNNAVKLFGSGSVWETGHLETFATKQ